MPSEPEDRDNAEISQILNAFTYVNRSVNRRLRHSSHLGVTCHPFSRCVAARTPGLVDHSRYGAHFPVRKEATTNPIRIVLGLFTCFLGLPSGVASGSFKQRQTGYGGNRP
jgi:hypothetical protein